MTTANCYRFSPDSDNTMQVISGLPAKKTYRNGQAEYFVQVAAEHSNHEVFAANDIVVTKGEDMYRVYRANLVETERTEKTPATNYELVRYSGTYNTTLLLVMSRPDVASNTGTSRPHFEKVVTWIGADGTGLTLQAGRHQSHSKAQLFKLRESESILFIDSKKEVTKITANKFKERPTCTRASNGEVADYVIGEARKRGNNPSTRAWCFYALQELGCQKQLDEFSRIFPGFRPKS